jgi:hypothetical protein
MLFLYANLELHILHQYVLLRVGCISYLESIKIFYFLFFKIYFDISINIKIIIKI